jgi:hypothetical protein
MPPRSREGGADGGVGGHAAAANDERATTLFDEAWRLRTVQHISVTLAVRPSVDASEEFKALPRALKVLAWEGSADEEGEARAKESWCAKWALQFPGDAVGGASPTGSSGAAAPPLARPEPALRTEPQPEPEPEAEPQSGRALAAQGDHRAASTDHTPELLATDVRHRLDADSIRRLEQERDVTREESTRLRRQMEQLQVDERRLRDEVSARREEVQRVERQKIQLQLDRDAKARELDTVRGERNDAVQRMEAMQEQRPLTCYRPPRSPSTRSSGDAQVAKVQTRAHFSATLGC